MGVEAKINKFQRDCESETPETLVRKYLVAGTSFFFDNIEKSKSELEFKQDIAQSMGVGVDNVLIVGSGKLGFSLKPEKDSPGLYLYKKFDQNFKLNPEKEKSDIDVAVIAEDFFNRRLEDLYNFTNAYTKNYTASSSDNFNFCRGCTCKAKFAGYKVCDLGLYALKGWLRQDKFPPKYKYPENVENVKKKYQLLLGRKVTIGVYRSMFFFEKYHQRNIHSIKINLSAVK